MRLVVLTLALMASGPVSASAALYCGIIQMYGRASYVYATVNDGEYNASITGDTYDPNRQVRKLVGRECSCVRGELGGDGNFAVVSRVGRCN